jgi:uncharacterized protein (DUF1800 family)
MGERRNAVALALAEDKIHRAIVSRRQLEEVLVDFWFNHFNVDARKGRVRLLIADYEQIAIRPYVLGRFRDMLGATARHPAMLFYLDNWLNTLPATAMPASVQRRLARQPARGRRGPNENYARELMELHTLGVDGGYTERDVVEVARAFTGWTIGGFADRDAFRFVPRLHDSGEKVVLGHRLAAGRGVEDGERVLDLLASRPATARFVSAKLARRFVSDTPPATLIERMAAAFVASGGDLRAVMCLLLASPEFLAPPARGAKFKTPLEFVVSAVRAADLEMLDLRALVRSVADLGMPLYQCQPPTGYRDAMGAWANAGALVARLNFALALSDRLTRPPDQQQALALKLGAPAFQQR